MTSELQVPTLSEAVADWIAGGIVRGRWSAGDRLREVEVCEELGVSRAPVREAIRILDAKGLVRHVPRIGAIINHFSTETVMDVYQVRAVMERWLCEESVPALENEELDQLDELLQAMIDAEGTHDHASFFDFGWRFRTTLYSGSTNGVAFEVVDQLRGRLHSLPQILRGDERHVSESIAAYTNMAASARKGDAGAVGQHVYDFMISVGSYVCERYMDVDLVFPLHKQETL